MHISVFRQCIHACSYAMCSRCLDQGVHNGSNLLVENIHVLVLLQDLRPHQAPVRFLRELAPLEASSLEVRLGHAEHFRIGSCEVGDRQ